MLDKLGLATLGNVKRELELVEHEMRDNYRRADVQEARLHAIEVAVAQLAGVFLRCVNHEIEAKKCQAREEERLNSNVAREGNRQCQL